MDDNFGGLIGLLFMLAAVIFVIYCIMLLVGVLVTAAGAGGVIWGGGTAIINYGKSFKENMIDSNLAAA